MTDTKILKEIEDSAHASSAMSLFLSHAFCILAQQSGVDLKILIEQLQSLSPAADNADNSESFREIYNKFKEQLILNLKKT